MSWYGDEGPFFRFFTWSYMKTSGVSSLQGITFFLVHSFGMHHIYCVFRTGMLVQCSLPTSPRWKGALRELHFSPKNKTEWASQGVKFPNMIPLWLLRHSLLLSHDHTSCALEHYWKNFCSWLPTLRRAGCCPDGCIRMRLCWCCFKSINHSGYQPMRRKYFVTCMNLDTQQKYIIFILSHAWIYICPRKKHI